MSIDYLQPFAMLRTEIRTPGAVRTITISKELSSPSRQGLTPAWYAPYSEAATIDRGDFTTELRQFAEARYEEGQIRRKVSVDENWYRRHCPDINRALCAFDDIKAQNHSDELRYIEGRPNSPIAEVENGVEAIERSAFLAGDRIGATEP
jgi:hypothetical protein